MSSDSIDNRKYKRIFFAPKDDIQSIICTTDPNAPPLVAKVMNLSEGGIGLSIRNDAGIDINEGAQLVIQEIQGSEPLGFMQDLRMQIKWTVHNPALEHTGFGCEFLQVPVETRKQLQDFVTAWHLAKSRP